MIRELLNSLLLKTIYKKHKQCIGKSFVDSSNKSYRIENLELDQWRVPVFLVTDGNEFYRIYAVAVLDNMNNGGKINFTHSRIL